MHAFISRRIPEAGLRVFEAADVSYSIGQHDTEHGIDRVTLIQGIRGADVLVSLLTERIDRDALAANPSLRGVANMAVGYNNIDVAEATRLGIPVSNTPGVLTETTADLTWALLLAVSRRIPAADRYMRSGKYRVWGPDLLLGTDVSPGGTGRRKTIGIIGFGRIGRAVARRARAFDLRILAHSPDVAQIAAFEGAEYATLETLLRESDFVTLHAPLTPDTHHLIGEAQLRLMKPTSFLINTSRGELVEERMLVRALREGWIAGAALDVYEHEPAMAAGLADCPNTVLVPHIGSASSDTRNLMARMAAENALAHLRGEHAANVVNPEVYETEAYRSRLAGV